MQYRTAPKTGDALPVLGYGCMRFPKKRGGVDQGESTRLVQLALDRGVNYFDTAYIYPGSEEALGRALEQLGAREEALIATKLPHYLLRRAGDAEKIFRTQLARLRTDHIDYYLMHMLPDAATWRRLCQLGIPEWLAGLRRQGRIRRIGFSYHGHREEFLKLLGEYDWDFVQIQYNYMDENSQAGRRGLEAAQARGLPVFIMEPLRGGRLTEGLPPTARRLIEEHRPPLSPAALGLNWLWDQPGVTCVLSGMGTAAMLEENCRLADRSRPGMLDGETRALIDRVRGEINRCIRVGCTGCGYCLPCPAGVDIPGVFRCYNERYTDGWFTAVKEYTMCTTLRRTPSYASLCQNCGKCERHCPQALPIRRELNNAARVLENPAWRAARWAVKKSGRFG